jgi:hypothetical protein
MVDVRGIKHPRWQHADRGIGKATEQLFALAIALATTHGQRLAMERKPSVVHHDRLRMMGIM